LKAAADLTVIGLPAVFHQQMGCLPHWWTQVAFAIIFGTSFLRHLASLIQISHPSPSELHLKMSV